MVTLEIESFLAERHCAALATTGRDGYPQVTIMWYLFERGRFYMTTTTDRVKYHNVRRDPRIGFAIYSDPYKGVMVKADVVDFIFDDLATWNRRIAARYTAPERLDAQVAQLLAAPRVILDIVPRTLKRLGW
jgi:PPOX class probable F420-dependent enzyme